VIRKARIGEGDYRKGAQVISTTMAEGYIPPSASLNPDAYVRGEPVMAEQHPDVATLLRYFEYGHLPKHLQAVSRPCGELAQAMVERAVDHRQLAVGLQKLLEAKDCFVRASLP
jgi:hypothetical protein